MVQVETNRRSKLDDHHRRVVQHERVQLREVRPRQTENARSDSYNITTERSERPSNAIRGRGDWNNPQQMTFGQPLRNQPAPTPLRQGDAPNQQVKVNTIQNPHVAPKSQLRGAVNAAILATQILGTSRPELDDAVRTQREAKAAEVLSNPDPSA